MNTVTIFHNAVDPFDKEEAQGVDDVCAYLATKFSTFPDTAHIYHEYVSAATDVTPHCEADIERLQKLKGNFFVVVWPEAVLPLIIGIIALVAALTAVAIGIAFLLRPTTTPTDSSSPNNEVGNRENKARPNSRIPDIVGTVRSTPDLLALPYKVFEDNQEFEICYMGIGRGSYTILDCQDDQTPVDEIAGEWVAVYPPDNSPNSTVPAPQATFGVAPAVIPKVVSVQQSNAVNGQVILPSNAGYLEAQNNVSFGYGGTVNGTGIIDFTQDFIASTVSINSYLQIFTNDDGLNASDSAEKFHSVGLAGTYKILSVTPNQMVLSNPSAVNPNWNAIANFSGQVSAANHTFVMTSDTSLQDGPYILNVKNMTEVWANFVAEQGLYYVDSSGNQKSLTITIQLTAQAINSALQPIGDPISATVNVVGEARNHNICGATLKMVLPTPGPVMVSVLRTTPQFIYHSNLAMVDQIQWRDLFAVSEVVTPNGDFGDITTALAITAQTQDALSIKSRKLNFLVTRNLPTWINRGASGPPQFSSALTPTNNAADIICALALDQAIGRRQLSELDVAGIYGVADASYLGGEHTNGDVVSYFGTFLMAEFCYTFDDAKTSFEESLNYIAQAINCIGYRSASTINLSFEKQTANSTLLFNHRNKLPLSETRTVSFGVLNNNDGVQYDYIDPNAPNNPDQDVKLTLYYPPSQTAIAPKSIASIGVRNIVQATINAWRLYLKIIYANIQTSFEATQEAALCILNDRILVADNTRTGTQDGEIVAQSGLVVTTSQPLTFIAGAHTVYLQHYDGTVEAITVTEGSEPDQMILAQAPSLPLVTDPTMFARTTYILVSNSTTMRPLPFLITNKDPQENNTFKLTAINYSDNYYDHDQDFIDGIILPPPHGYAAQGYTGSGLQTIAGTTFPSSRLGFDASTYTGSALQTTNNPKPPVTASPVVYQSGAANLVPDSDLRWQTDTNPMNMTYWSNPGPAWTCGLGAGNQGMNAFVVSSAVSGTSEVSVSTPFSVVPGQQYTLSGFIDASGVTAGSIQMDVYDDGLTTSYATLSAAAGADATTYFASFVCPAGVTQMVVVCSINGATIASSLNVMFSTPQLQVGSEATAYVSGPLDVAGSIPYSILPTNTRTYAFDQAGNVLNVGGTAAATIIAGVETANEALANAATAQAAANTAQDLLNTIATTSILTPGQKASVISDYNSLIAAQAANDAQAVDVGVSHAAYDAAISALTTYLATLTSPVLWSDTSSYTEINGTDFASDFEAAYSAQSALLNAIYTAINATANTGVVNAASALANAATAQAAADAANALLATIAESSVLMPGQKPAIVADYNALIAAQAASDAQADAVGVSRTVYDAALSALTTYLGTLTSPVAWNVTTNYTTIVGATFTSKFQAAYAAQDALLNAIATAINTTSTSANSAVLLQNPNFAAGNVGWTFAGPCSIVSGTPAVPGSSFVGQFVSATAVNGALSNNQSIPCSAGAVLSMAAYIAGASGATGVFQVELVFYNSSGTALTEVFGNAVSPGAGWIQSRVVGTAPTNTAYAQAAINSYNGVTTNASGAWEFCGASASIQANSLDEVPDGTNYRKVTAVVGGQATTPSIQSGAVSTAISFTHTARITVAPSTTVQLATVTIPTNGGFVDIRATFQMAWIGNPGSSDWFNMWLYKGTNSGSLLLEHPQNFAPGASTGIGYESSDTMEAIDTTPATSQQYTLYITNNSTTLSVFIGQITLVTLNMKV